MKGKILGKKNIFKHKMCAMIFASAFVRKIFFLMRIKRDFIINVHTVFPGP